VTESLCFLSAVDLAELIATRQLSAAELVAAHLEQIARTNPAVNAIVTLVPEQALVRAREIDESLADDGAPSPLTGLPVVHKDLEPTAGIRTTMGSPIFADWIPDESSLIVEQIRAAGAITVGKSNTPEFGAGSQTFNRVFGATLNPWDTSRTCGGSSGGAAVALACGMVPLADGSDTGGSLRNPASFCSVVGFRPSPGRVPTWPARDPWSPLSVHGPMARTVADAALFLAAIAGPNAKVPFCLSEPGSVFANSLEHDLTGTRVAWSPDAGGLPIEPQVVEALAGVPATLEAIGCTVVDGFPDLGDAGEIFETLRGVAYEASLGELYDERSADLKDTVRWNIELGRRLTTAQAGEATRSHAQLLERVVVFMEMVDFLALPVSQVAPFDVGVDWPREVAGMPMRTYIEWMRSCSDITLTGCPAISVPAGFTGEGLPVGLQLVGRFRDDLGVLRLAHAFEAATGLTERRPPVATRDASGS
jgi:amidase